MKNLVCVGSVAPDLALDGIDPARDRPRVVAFIHAWSGDRERPEALAELRAELRGLGAELVVLADDATWAFGPDDHVERVATGPDLAEQVRRARRAFGVPTHGDAVVVVDHEGRVAFVHRSATPLATSLAEALSAASDAMVTAPQPVLFSRREWNVTALVTGFAFVFLSGCKAKEQPSAPRPAPPRDDVAIRLQVNGKQHALRVDPRSSLLDTLRERLGLTGTKKGCDMGQCGACTVLANGERVLSCLTLAVMAQDRKLVTIEGLARGDELHPMQQAFIEHDGLQCGYCTPGQILSAVALLAEGRAKTDAEIRAQMSGNLCRCGAQPNIIAAIQAVRRQGGA